MHTIQFGWKYEMFRCCSRNELLLSQQQNAVNQWTKLKIVWNKRLSGEFLQLNRKICWQIKNCNWDRILAPSRNRTVYQNYHLNVQRERAFVLDGVVTVETETAYPPLQSVWIGGENMTIVVWIGARMKFLNAFHQFWNF